MIRRPLAVSTVLLGIVCSAGGGMANPGAPGFHKRVDRAVALAIKHLSEQIGPDGMVKKEYPADHPHNLHGGKTALCLYALLSAGADQKSNPAADRALRWLMQAELDGTYAVAMRVCALAGVKDRRMVAHLLNKDVRRLVKAAAETGSYTYDLNDKHKPLSFDNSNSQFATLGVWAGAGSGIEVPLSYWRHVEKHWLSQQQPDGGFNYHCNPGGRSSKSYGSMTAAGVATLLICFENLRRSQFIRCTASTVDKPLLDGIAWLEKNFSADSNPRKKSTWYYYWLYCLERVGLASGYKYFGRHNWYAECAKRLLATQNSNGSWGAGGPNVAVNTAFALLFLARGRNPVLVNKLIYDGKWNARPSDTVNLTRWLTRTFERPVNWQIVRIDSPLADWHDAPILYISGAGPFEITAEQVEKLRNFALQGGLILSEAACNSADFTLDMQKLYKRLFPNIPLKRLPDDHPIYSLHFSPEGLTGLAGVSNGVRLLAIHSARELSLALQLARGRQDRPWFELLANIYLHATDKGQLRPRGTNPWPEARAFTPVATIRLARLKHAGNCLPEPLAFQRLAILMGNRHHIRLEVSEPMNIVELDAEKFPVAAMTGTETFRLSEAETISLQRFLASGGTLVVDAAGGSKAFIDAVEAQLPPLVPNGRSGLVASEHVIYRSPERIDKIKYRRAYSLAAGTGHDPRMRGVLLGGRFAILYSGEDITTGLLGRPVYRLRGYSPETAVKLMTNILCYAANRRTTTKPIRIPR
ncbi:MAG: DUF4159 domain-containing protein [Planctomycetota bacterium]|nr:DUF4159 domain-containing protein [Planctomycetota bacterium]